MVAYFDCRRNKRNTANALAFERDLEQNLRGLAGELLGGSYRPGPSICFVVTRPKPREVWAASFRDRVVHHLLYNRIAPRFERSFIADSCACIKGRGTLYAAQRLEAKVRSITENWSRPAFYLKCDLANFFVSIDKRILAELLAGRVFEPWWRALAEQVLFHDPRPGAEVQSAPERLALIPAHKSLWLAPAHLGLSIGNLSSQFFANVYLDVLDQHVKHRMRARRYVRYVDDFILLHESAQQLSAWRDELAEVLAVALRLRLNDAKTILQPLERGVDFVGHVIKPWRRIARRRTIRAALQRLQGQRDADFHRSANSYFGLLRQASHSHHDRARLANLVRHRGFAVNRGLTQTMAMIKILPPGLTFEQALRLGYTGEIRLAGYLKWIRTLPCDCGQHRAPSQASHGNFFKSQKRKGPDPLAIPENRECHEAYERNGFPDEQRRLARAALYMLQAIYEGRLVWRSSS